METTMERTLIDALACGAADLSEENAHQHARDHAVVREAVDRLEREIHNSDRLDTHSLKVLGRFLQKYPWSIYHARAHRPADPERRERFNVLLVRAQVEASR